MDQLENIDQFAAKLLAVSFFLPMKWQVLVTIGLCVYFVFRSLLSKQFPPAGNYLWALFLGSGFVLYLLAVPLTPPEWRKTVLHIVERKESLLLLPLAFAIMAPGFKTLIAGELLYFVVACVISCIAGNADYFYHYFFVNGGLHEFSHVRYRIIFESFTGIHPTYMGLYLCFSMCILLGADFADTLRGKIIKYVVIYLLLIFLLSLLAKSPLIALIIIFIHYGWVRRKELLRYKWTIAGLMGTVAATSYFIPFFRQRLAEIFVLAGGEKGGNVTGNSVSTRKLIWEMDTDLIRHNWLTGIGPGRLLRALEEKYFFFSLSHGYNVGHYDPHNQYFSEWISFGVSGIVLLAAIIVVQFVKAVRQKNYLYLYLLILLSITFFTETFLSRQQGVLFYAVFTSLFFFSIPGLKPLPPKGRSAI